MIVASFWAPRPEHPFFQDYQPFLKLLDESCRKYGHQHIVLTDDATMCGECDTHETPLPRSLMKATVAAQYAYLSNPQFANVPTLLTGADCVLANDPIVMALSHDAGQFPDIVITTDDRFQDCRMNCGAIFIPRPADVAPIWKVALDQCGDDWGDDQISVYAAILASDLVVHELPCDPYNLAPENPSDNCSRGIVLHFRGPRKRWMVDYCHKNLSLGDGITLTLAPNVNEAGMLENIRINGALAVPWLKPVNAHDDHAVLIGGGPSLASALPEIRWRQSQKQKLFALNGVGAHLHEHGIFPEYGAVLDPRAANTKFIGPYVGTWLLASQCHPDLIEKAQQIRPTYLWHFYQEGIERALPRQEEGAFQIGGGLTIGLTAMGLAFAMGYRKLHLYGYDSSNAEASHAYEQDETAIEAAYVEVWCDGRPFICGPAMYAQAKAFPEWANTLAQAGATITVHGDGLLPTVARGMNSATSIEAYAA